MSELRFYQKHLKGIPVGQESRFPALRDPIKSTIDSQLGEDDGLFVNYGMLSDSLPYAMQDDYDLTPMQEMTLDAACLENEHLLAEFTLDLGGRLWRLYDKDAKRDLLTNNQEFRPRNLAIRNAWFAGGTEWNCGRRGHDANTCSPRFAAELRDPEYGPVLRIYDYSRDRKTPYQMDFFLPDGSRFLFSRVRIANPGDEVIPMYWWSNIAADMTPGARVVVPAMDTYVNKYDGGSHFITRIPLPEGEGFDSTYPERFGFVRDHFYNIPENSRKYEALIKPDGTGFVHMSTRRLQGRKLFVWGTASGGEHWQKKLLSEGLCDYIELQAGVAKTQQEHLPMPPHTVWEWLEAYGAIQADKSKVFGEWKDAVQSVTARLDAVLPEAELDRMLSVTRERLAKQPGELRYSGLGFAALEERRAGKRLAPQLDFGTPGEAQSEWVRLLETGKFDDAPPKSYQADPDWLDKLLAAPGSWKRDYHLALYYFRMQDRERVMRYAQSALDQKRNAWTLQLQGNVLLRFGGTPQEAMPYLLEAARTDDADAYLVKEVMKLLIQFEMYTEALEFFSTCSKLDQARPMMKSLYAAALAHTGKLDEAEALLTEGEGLELPDAREGIVDITKLYLWIQKEKGIPENQINVPFLIDYRTK